MKVLTIEQMNRLKELGVDTSIASMAIYDIYAGENKVYDIIALNGAFHEEQEYDRFGYGIHSAVAFCKKPVFSLQDIIELLPKSISHKYEVLSKTCEDTYVLVWDMEGGVLKYCDDIGCEREYTNHAIIHVNEIGILESFYQMLIWVIENGYLKTK